MICIDTYVGTSALCSVVSCSHGAALFTSAYAVRHAAYVHQPYEALGSYWPVRTLVLSVVHIGQVR